MSLDGFSAWLGWFDSSGWLGLLGLAISVVGFAATAFNVVRSRRSSDRAREAAEAAVLEVQSLKSVTDLSAAISELDGVRRLLRENSWTQLPERLSYVRKLLIGVGAKGQGMELQADDEVVIRDSIAVFSSIEQHIDSAARGKVKINGDRINSQLIDRIDKLYELIARIL